MQLPARDAAFLAERGSAFELLPDPNGGAFLIIKNFDVSTGGFTPATTDLMVRIPPQYPITQLDMWYCDPPIRIAATGQFATASEVMEPHLGRTWQRFSRHLNGSWKPGVDSLRSFFVFIQRELHGVGRS
ncbi:MAG: E2/UBC family protein [Granulicella sp.]